MKTVWIVHQYASTPETGMGGRHYYLGRELAKQGYQVYLIASASHHLMHKKPDLVESIKIETISDDFHFVWVKMPDYAEAHSKQRVLNWFLFPWRILKLTQVIPDNPDTILVSSPSPFAFLGAQRLARKLKARLVFEVRDIWPLTLTEIGGYSPQHPFIWLMQWVEDKAYRNSDRVISNLKNAVEHMISRGMDSTKFTWVSNGFSLDEVNQRIALNDQTVSQLPTSKFVVGYTGTFGLANDLYSLLDAAAKVKDYPDIAFVLVGGGKDKMDLVSYAEKKSLSNVYFIDFVEKRKVQSVLCFFDILAVGAKKEPMYRFGVSPNKLFDYLAAGKPIIYHIESGDYHPVRDASCGYEVESQNPQQLADAILTLYKMTAEAREVMGANSRKAAIEQYEYGRLAKKLADVLFA